jgi:hypothetical protein
MERVAMSPAAIDYEFKYRGQLLFVDTDGQLMVWGRASKRVELTPLLIGRDEEVKRFLIARALRAGG